MCLPTLPGRLASIIVESRRRLRLATLARCDSTLPDEAHSRLPRALREIFVSNAKTG